MKLIQRRAIRQAKSLRRNLVGTLFAARNQDVASVIQSVLDQHLTYLSKEALIDLAKAALANEARRLDGIMIEAGCALGGSALVLASAKQPSRPFYIYDVFGMIPSPSPADGIDVHERYQEILQGKSEGIDGDKYYGYEENLYDQVVATFARFGMELQQHHLHLVQGLYQDVLHVDSPVALAHIDCDWHDSVMTCLSRIEPRLVRGGRLIIDDYYSWSGCRAAVDEYFAGRREHEYRFIRGARLHIVKQ